MGGEKKAECAASFWPGQIQQLPRGWGYHHQFFYPQKRARHLSLCCKSRKPLFSCCWSTLLLLITCIYLFLQENIGMTLVKHVFPAAVGHNCLGMRSSRLSPQGSSQQIRSVEKTHWLRKIKCILLYSTYRVGQVGTVVSMQSTGFFLVLFINYCIIYFYYNCKPTSAHPIYFKIKLCKCSLKRSPKGQTTCDVYLYHY